MNWLTSNKHRTVESRKRIICLLSLAFVHVIAFVYLAGILFTSLDASHTPNAVFPRPQTDNLVKDEEISAFEPKIPLEIKLYSSDDCSGKEVFTAKSGYAERNCEECIDMCGKRFPNSFKEVHTNVNSMKITSSEKDEEIQLIGNCIGAYSYKGNIPVIGTFKSSDGCVPLEDTSFAHIRFFSRQKWKGLIEDESTAVEAPRTLKKNDRVGKYIIAYSVEDTDYFKWQVKTNYYAFLKSKQKGATYMRLLSADKPDDMAESIPTFVANRHIASRAYSPINKPDSLDKWLHSSQSPQEEIVVVIDPDNWLLKDVSHFANMVSRGNAVAEAAWYYGDSDVDEVWSIVCEKNCERKKTDHVAVPVFIHRDDLKEIAPLWTHYTLKVRKLMKTDPNFAKKYSHNQITGWSVEMVGYVYAAAHVGIKHDIKRHIQIRDVDSRPSLELQKEITMIHMGRAWFPPEYEPGKKWWHTEGKEFSAFGAQVWCKCNQTAGEIVPWPLPDEIDFQSYHTLSLLHEALEAFGKVN